MIAIFLACGCDATGSSSLQCADTSGQCTCNAGYKGTKCDATCGCDTTGSSGTACDASTGQCTCNTGYTGTTCNSCDTNYYRTSGGTCAGQYLYLFLVEINREMHINTFCFQPVVVMPRVQAVYSVLIRLVNVPAMLDIKAQNVMLLVVVIPLVQTVQHVMLLQVNVLARMVLLVPLVPLLQVRFCQ